MANKTCWVAPRCVAVRHQSRRPHLTCDNVSHIASLPETRQDETTREQEQKPAWSLLCLLCSSASPVVYLGSPLPPSWNKCLEQVTRTRIATRARVPLPHTWAVNRFVTVVGFGFGFEPDRPLAPSHYLCLRTIPLPTDRAKPLLCSCMLRNTAAPALPHNTFTPLWPPSHAV